ncbi:MAG: carboxypeptidase-like regulatory domain-containing protein [Planctomycetota bacterium]
MTGARVRLVELPEALLEDGEGVRRDLGVDGDVHFTDIPPGQYVVRVNSELAGVRVVAGVACDTTILLDRWGVVQGRVVDRDGRPVEGAEILLMDREHDAPQVVAHSDHDGRFGPLPQDEPTLLAHKPGYVLALQGEHFNLDGDADEREFVLDRAEADLDVSAVDEIGRAVGGAECIVIDLDAPSPAEASWSTDRKRRVVAGADGHAHFEGLRKGKAKVYARAEGMAPSNAVVDLDGTGACRVVLHRSATLTGTARYADGTALAGARIRVSMPVPWPSARTTADIEGRFQVGGLPQWNPAPEGSEGHARLTTHDGASARRSLDFGDLDHLEWNVVLDRPGRLRGRVVDEFEHGLRNLQVSCHWASKASLPVFAWTEEGGSFEVAVDRGARLEIRVRDSHTSWAEDLASLSDQPVDGAPLHIVVPSSKRASAYVTAKLIRPRGFENAILHVVTWPAPRGEQDRPLDLCGVGTDGRLLVGPLRPGSLSIETFGLDSLFPSRQIATTSVQSDQTVDLGEIRLATPAVLTLLPALEGATEAPAFTARLLDPGSKDEILSIAYAKGRTACDRAVEPGTYLLSVDAGTDHQAVEMRCEVFDGIDNRIDVVLKRPDPVKR